MATARALVGAPYAYIGDDPSTGFSCIGFVHYVYAQVGVDVPYDLGAAYAAAPRVGRAALRPGDLVFFSNTVWTGLSHVALYVGDGQIIGADNYTTGVEMTHLSDPYWRAHYTGATRPLAALGAIATELDPSPIAAPRPTATPSPVPTATPAATPTAMAPAPTVRVGEMLRAGVAGNAYSGPGYAYPQVDRLSPGARLRVASEQGTWADVSYQEDGVDYAGWVDGRYLARCAVTAGSTAPRRRS